MMDVQKRMRNIAFDFLDIALGNRGQLPPLKLRRIIGVETDFVKRGKESLEILTNMCALNPNNKVLDVGCGVGVVAYELKTYLSQQGSYCGIDVNKDFTDWLSSHFSASNFRFVHADVLNKSYNPHGKCKASEYSFPFSDSSFDVVFLFSVFTHLFPVDMEHYLEEIKRVLVPNGKCLITYYLISNFCNRTNFMPLSFTMATLDRENPEKGLAYTEDYVLRLYRKTGLEISEIEHKHEGLQDIIVATKEL